MGSFNDYLESLKYTVGYIQAKVQDEFANSVLAQMQRTGISKEDLIAETLMRDEFIDDMLGGNTTEPLLNIEDICAIACTFDCDVKIELVPKKRAGE